MQVSTQGTARVSRRRTRAVVGGTDAAGVGRRRRGAQPRPGRYIVEVTPGRDVDDRGATSRIVFGVVP